MIFAYIVYNSASVYVCNTVFIISLIPFNSISCSVGPVFPCLSHALHPEVAQLTAGSPALSDVQTRVEVQRVKMETVPKTVLQTVLQTVQPSKTIAELGEQM